MTHKEDSENNNVILTFSSTEIRVRSGGNQKNNYRMSVLHEKHHDTTTKTTRKKNTSPSVIKNVKIHFLYTGDNTYESHEMGI